jgi:hypothetical protein
MPLPPQTEGSHPPTAAAEEYDSVHSHADPMWDAVAVHHLRGRVKTPIAHRPQTEGSSPPTTAEEYDLALPPDDPLWDVVAVDHMAGRVKTPATSAAYEWYEEDPFKGKKRKRASEEMPNDPRRFGQLQLD